jgi:hypothetical protein
MPMRSVRITDDEKERLRAKLLEINKVLVMRDQMPLKGSELVHQALDLVINQIQVDEAGNLAICGCRHEC